MKYLVTGTPGWLGTRFLRALTGKLPDLEGYWLWCFFSLVSIIMFSALEISSIRNWILLFKFFSFAHSSVLQTLIYLSSLPDINILWFFGCHLTVFTLFLCPFKLSISSLIFLCHMWIFWSSLPQAMNFSSIPPKQQ